MESRSHSLGLRIWHWLDGLVVLGLLATYFLRNGLVWTFKFTIQRLSVSNPAITFESARPILRDLIDRLWTWHIYFGYALGTLLVFRVILFFTDHPNPFVRSLAAFRGMREHFDFRNLHSAVVRAGYVVFYILQLFMVLSGLALAFDDDLGIGKGLDQTIHEAHETVMWFFLFFVIAHVVGIFLAENTGDPGIVSSMINGGHRRE